MGGALVQGRTSVDATIYKRILSKSDAIESIKIINLGNVNDQLLNRAADLASGLRQVSLSQRIDFLFNPRLFEWLKETETVLMVSGPRWSITVDSQQLLMTIMMSKELKERSGINEPWKRLSKEEGSPWRCILSLHKLMESTGRTRVMENLSVCLPGDHEFKALCRVDSVSKMENIIIPNSLCSSPIILCSRLVECNPPSADQFMELPVEDQLLWIGAIGSRCNVLLNPTKGIDPFISNCSLPTGSLPPPVTSTSVAMSVAVPICQMIELGTQTTISKSFILDLIQSCDEMELPIAIVCLVRRPSLAATTLRHGWCLWFNPKDKTFKLHHNLDLTYQ